VFHGDDDAVDGRFDLGDVFEGGDPDLPLSEGSTIKRSSQATTSMPMSGRERMMSTMERA